VERRPVANAVDADAPSRAARRRDLRQGSDRIDGQRYYLGASTFAFSRRRILELVSKIESMMGQIAPSDHS
jgi:hypothetical protein